MSKARDTVEALRTAVLDADIGTTVQAHDADTAKLDANANFTGTLQRGGTNVLVAGDVTNANFTGADLAVVHGGTGASSAGAARTNLGLAIGSDVLAPDGSAANLTNLPAGGNTSDFVASGTLPNGKPVILKANGQVEVVGITSTPISQSIPAAASVTFETGNTTDYSVSFDPNTANKFVIVYQDSADNYYGKATIGSISGTTISFATPVLFHATSTAFLSVSFDPNVAGKFVVSYRDNSNSYYGTAKLGSVSGTSITFGSAVIFNSTTTNEGKISFDPNTSGKFVITYANATNSSRGEAVIGTLSGSSLSFGSAVVFNSSASTRNSLAFDPNSAGKFVITFRNGGNSNAGTAIVGTMSGSSLSFGSLVAFDSSGLQLHGLAFDPNVAGKFVVVYRDYGNNDYGTGIVGQISGTTTSFGSKYVFSSSGETNHFGLSFDPNTTGKFVVAYSLTNSSTGNITGEVKVGTISNTALSFSSAFQLSADNYYLQTAFDPNSAGKFVTTYYDGSGGSEARLGQIASASSTTNLTATNFLGTATAAYTNGQTASIMLKGGISDNQTSLTAGSTYYVQPAGTFATSAGTPSVLAGEAVSATSLLLNGLATPAAPDEIPSQTSQSGKFLTTNGSAASWGTVAPAGLVLLSTVTASNSATVDIETTFDSTYDSYILMLTAVRSTNNNQTLEVRCKIGGSYRTGNNYFHLTKPNSASASYSSTVGQNSAELAIAKGLASANAHHLNLNLYISQPSLTDRYHILHWAGGVIDGNQYALGASGFGYNQNTGALTGIRFILDGGTIRDGTFKLYGVAK